MKHTHLFRVLILCLIFQNSNSQEYQDAVLPKQNIQKGSDVSPGLDLSTGVVSPSIHLMDLKGRMQDVSVDLVYTGGQGLRTGEVASCVGWGWDLQVGGKVEREVKGIRDEKRFGEQIFPMDATQQCGWLDDQLQKIVSTYIHKKIYDDISLLPIDVCTIDGKTVNCVSNTANSSFNYINYVDNTNPCEPGSQYTCGEEIWTYEVRLPVNGIKISEMPDFFRNETPQTGVPLDIWKQEQKKYFFNGWTNNQYSEKQFDTEPDVFTFTFGQYHGQFVFNKDGYPVIFPYQDIKIEPAIGPHANGTSWVFTTPDGFKYIFSDTEMTLFSHTYIWNYSPDSYEYISAWYLNYIIDPLGSTTSFDYYPNGVQTNNEMMGTMEPDFISGNRIDIYKDCLGNICEIPSGSPMSIIRTINKQEIYRITSDYGSIDFIDDSQFRKDMPFGFSALKYIRLNNSKTFEFNYEYFGDISQGANNSMPSKHLKLTGIKQLPLTGSTTPLEYKFEYENFSPDPGNPGLPGIPTPNRYWYLDKWNYFNNDPISTQPSTSCNTNCTYHPPLSVSLILKEAGRSEGADRLPSYIYTKEGVLNKIIGPLGGSISYEYELNNYFNSVSGQNSGQNENWGGLRIKRIIEKPNGPSSTLQSVKEFKYNLESDPLKSSGEVVQMRRQYDHVDYYNSAGVYQGQYLLRYSSPNRDNAKDFIRYTHVEVVTPGNGKTSYDFSGYSTNPDVSAERWNFNPANTNSWSQYYTDKDNDAGAPSNDRSLYRGLLLKERTYKELPSGSSATPDQLKISEVNYDYEFAPDGYTPEIVQASRINCDQKIYQANSNVNSVQSFNIEYYNHQSNWKFLKSVIKKQFAQDGNSYNPNKYLLSETYFSYNSNHPSQLTSLKTVNSDNKVTSTNYIYPSDLQDDLSLQTSSDEAWALRKMVEANIISSPIETFVRDETDPTHILTLKSMFLQYHDYGPSIWGKNMYLTHKIFVNRFKVPSENFSPIYFQNDNVNIDLVHDGNYELEYLYDEYDKYGHILTEHRNKGPEKSHLWGYEGSVFPVADFIANKNENKSSVTGSPYQNIGNECSYLGYESNSNPAESDYWYYFTNSDRSHVISTDAHTGNKCQFVAEAGTRITINDPMPSVSLPTGGNFRSTNGPFSFSASHAFIPDNQLGTYKFGAWIKTSQNFSSNDAWLVMDIQHHDGTEIIDPSNQNSDVGYHYKPITNNSSEWKYFEVAVSLEEFRTQYSSLLNSDDDQLNILCYLVNYDETAYNYVLIDDIRFNSIEAEGSSYTYGSSWLKSTISDINNLPSYIYYDAFNRIEGIENFRHEVLKYFKYYSNNVFNPNTPNYTKTFIPKIPYNINSLRSGTLPDDNFIISTNYSDGNGRTLQNNIKDYFSDGSGSNFDLIQPVVYDQYGRQNVNYLPYSYSISGVYDPNYLNHQLSFYSNADKVAHDSRPFSENVFELSAMGQLVEQSPSGSAWNLANHHTIKNSFDLNTSTEVVQWSVSRDGDGEYTGAAVIGYYPPNSLLKTKTINEENHISYSFYDKRGKIVCKKFEAYTDVNNKTRDFTSGQLSNSGGSVKPYSIYYVYDEFEKLVYSISVQNDNSLITTFNDDEYLSDDFFKGRVEANHYDSHGRVTAHHVCDGGWEYSIYNSQDQVVMSQNPKLRENDEWYVLKYDALGRVTIKGTTNLGGLDLHRTQNEVNAETNSFVRTSYSDQTGYSISDTYPPDIDNVHEINMYDAYGFSDATLTGRTYQQANSDFAATHSDFVTGKLTASKTRVLPSGDFLSNVNYFDDDGRLIQQHNQNYIDYPNSWDVQSVQYSFMGNVNKNLRAHLAFNSSTQIKTRYLYDRIGRVKDVFKQINSEPEVHLINNSYNCIGQLIRKKIHDQPIWNQQFLQGIDYRYNIRGWLTSINNASLMNDGSTNLDDDDVFGEQLYYENPNISNSNFQALPFYDGKISQIIWRTKPAPAYLSFDLRPIHLYTYRYDDFGRLTAGYYACNSASNPIAFDKNINRYLEKENYDAFGNIQSLVRNSDKGMPIDNLEYTYISQSNQLSSIKDFVPGSPQDNDFHDGATSTSEFEYDSGGNLKKDDNKNITLNYNFLNLPDQVNGQSTMVYTYDAAGNKLASAIDGVTHYYVNGIEYDDNVMKFINTEEGRIRKVTPDLINLNSFVYDYFIKDHLGNIRVVLTTQLRENDYFATMEPQNGTVEEQLFYNISTTRDYKIPGYPIDNSYIPDTRASSLSIGLGRTIGHAKVVSVNGDDVIHLNTKYFFQNSTPDSTNTSPISDILQQLAISFVMNPSNGVSVAGSEQSARQDWADKTFISNPELNSFLTTTLNQNQINNPNQPKAYLVWLFFTASEFKFVPEASGLLQAANAGQLGDLAIMDLTMPENGYLYVYVTNQSTRLVDFDHLTIIHQGGRCLEENHYYPYGMLIEGLSFNPGIATNNYKFNSDHYETNNDLFNYLTTYRSYDPAIAKWNQLDPMNQFTNGYVAYAGNPVSFSDPLGLSAHANLIPNDHWEDAEKPKRDLFDNRQGGRGGSGFTDAAGNYFTDNELRAYNENIDFYNNLPREVRSEMGDLTASEYASEVQNGNIHVTISTTTPEIFAYSTATYMGNDNNPQWHCDEGIPYYSATHYYTMGIEENAVSGGNGNNLIETGYGINSTLDNSLTLTEATFIGAQRLANKVANVTYKVVTEIPILHTLGRLTGAISIVENFNKFYDNPTNNWWNGVEAVGQTGFMLFGGAEAELIYNLTTLGIDWTVAGYNSYNKK